MRKSKTAGARRARIVVSQGAEQLELFTVGTPDVTFDDAFAVEYRICRDAQQRVFTVETRQRLFREEKLRVIVKRLPKKRGELTATNCARISAAVAAAFGKEGR